MHGQFDSPIALPRDLTKEVDISGPLRDVDVTADEAKVLFLIVQDDGPNAITAQGEGTWVRVKGSEDTPWTGKVGRFGKKVGGDEAALHPGLARGIGVAIAVRDGELDADGNFVPPSIHALTWCANFMFDESYAT